MDLGPGGHPRAQRERAGDCVNEPGRVQTVGFADLKLLQAYHALESGTFEDRRLHSILAQAVKTLKTNPEAGPKVPRPLCPRIYIQSHGIDNLRKLDLPDGWRLRGKEVGGLSTIDPSVPEALEQVSREVRLLREWGYELIKHDYTSFDLLGRWGFSMAADLTAAMRQPRASISAKAGRMEREAPLFFGTGANPLLF